MRVALFSETFLPRSDGIVTVLCRLLDQLALRGIESMLFTPRLGPVERYAATRICSAPGLPFPPYADLRLALPTPRQWRRLRDFAPQVTHFLHPSVFGLAAWWGARRLGLPTLVSWHLDYGRIARHWRLGPLHAGAIEPGVNLLTRQVLGRADCALAPSRSAQGRLRDMGVKAPVQLWRRGVDSERFHPRHADAAMRRRLAAADPRQLQLLYVGRLSLEKGLASLRAALQALPQAQLALVGDGPARRALEAQFAGLPVRFTGVLQGRELAQAYASADVFVFPSLAESFGLVVLEAMASGLPPVAARSGGVPELLREGRNGYSFAPGDEAGLLHGVRRLAADAEHRRALGRQARADAEARDWSAAMDELIARYEGLALPEGR